MKWKRWFAKIQDFSAASDSDILNAFDDLLFRVSEFNDFKGIFLSGKAFMQFELLKQTQASVNKSKSIIFVKF